MEDVSIDMDGLNTHALSLLTVVQFWKHLSCQRLHFVPAVESLRRPAQLSVASVFNTLVSKGSFTKLTLDGQYRWFNCLPSVESTISTTLIGYVVGDYIGHMTSADLWPGCTNAEEIGMRKAYVWHWIIDVTSLSTGTSTVMSVLVESALVSQSPHAMETMSIAEKLRCIGDWHRVCEVRMTYNAQCGRFNTRTPGLGCVDAQDIAY